MSTKKSFQELEFKDAFLFALTMEDEDICRGVLERTLGISVKKVTVRSEKTLLINPEYRGVRMDVYADDEAGTVFDVEMQTTNRGNLPKRSRYYQSQMDSGFLKPGEHFNLLPQSFVIFLCTFDPFGRGRWRYTFEERCAEDGEKLGDGTCKVFLNAKGTPNAGKEDIPPELVRFLSYVGKGNDPGRDDASDLDDPLIRQINSRISSLKQDRKMEEQYMLFGEMLDDERKDGFEEGFSKGFGEGFGEGFGKAQSSLLTLIRLMQENGLEMEIPRLSSDPSFLQEMYKRFQLDK